MVKENQTITWGTFVKESEELILKGYDGFKTLSAYRGVWKNRFRTCAKMLNIQIVDDNYDHWETLIAHLQKKRNVAKKEVKGMTRRLSNESQSVPPPSVPRLTSSSSGSKPNYTLSSVEKDCIIKLMESIEEENKWKLESGRFVED